MTILNEKSYLKNLESKKLNNFERVNSLQKKI